MVYNYNDESGLKTDYTLSQVRSFAFAQAERKAIDRTHRLDDLKAVIAQIYDPKAFDDYMKLRQAIIESHEIQDLSEQASKLKKEDAKRYNVEAAKSMSFFLRN